MARDTTKTQTEQTEDTVETYEIKLKRTTGGGLKTSSDSPEPLSVPTDWLKSAIDARAPYNVDQLIKATNKGDWVGAVEVSVTDGSVDFQKIVLNQESVNTLDRFRSYSMSDVSESSASDFVDDDEEDEPEYTDDTEPSGSEDDTDQSETREYDVVVDENVTTGTRGLSVRLVGNSAVSWDLTCPMLAHKTDNEVFKHACKQTGRNPKSLVRGGRDGERVATVTLSEEGVEDVRLAR